MAIYHHNMKAIQRSAGRTATAAAAYRAACRVVDDRTGEIHDYTRKGGVQSARLILPGGGTADRAAFWSKVEVHHKHPRAVTAREVVVALLKELDAEQRRELAEQYGRDLADRYGVAADVCVHEGDGDNENWHAHILLTACTCRPDGVLGKKVEALDPIVAQRRAKDQPNAVEFERPRWAELANSALERAGRSERIDCRTLEEQGIDREATVHQGPARTNMMRKAERLARQAAAEVERLQGELSQAVAEKAAQVAAVAAAAVAAVAPLPAAAVPAPVAQVHQVEADDLSAAFERVAPAPQAQQRPAAPADPRPARAAEPPQRPQAQGQDQPSARAQAPAPRGAVPAQAPAVPRVVKTVEAPARSVQAEPPQQPARAQFEPSEPVSVTQTEPQERQKRAQAALQRVREASARLQAAEAAKGRAEGALTAARARRARHWDPEDAGKAEAVAKARAVELAKEYRELKARIEGRGLLARMAARVSDPEAERLEALWPEVQKARQEAADAGTRTLDAKVANGAAVKASYALRDAGQELQAATKAAQQAVEEARPYQVEIQAVLRQERADREAAEREAARLAQIEAEQREQDQADGWDYEA